MVVVKDMLPSKHESPTARATGHWVKMTFHCTQRAQSTLDTPIKQLSPCNADGRYKTEHVFYTST